MVTITLPDSTKKTFESSISIEDVAAEIGKGLFKATVGGNCLLYTSPSPRDLH